VGEYFLAIMNPAAGGGRCGKKAPEALAKLRDAGIEIEVMETHAPGDGVTYARRAWEDGHRNFIAVGGDGTGYEVVNGLFPAAAESGETPNLGFLPLGTGNSFLRDFTEDGANYSIQALIDGRQRPCDVIQLETREGQLLHYINILSIGFTADVGALTNRRFKPLGEPGYILAVVTEVARLKARPLPMAVDGGAMDDEPMTFVSFNNSRYTGGQMMMAPHADTADGFAALVKVGRMGRATLLQTFPKIFKGTHVSHPAISTAKVKTVEFELDEPVELMIDGEVIKGTPTRLKVLPGALTVRV